MMGLFITDPWPLFYRKGMKTWEIRSYPTEYRGTVLLIESRSNKVICQMQLIDCIPLSKERWEMNYEKHRTACSYETLPYKTKISPAYAWVLKNPIIYDDEIIIQRSSPKPYISLPIDVTCNKPCHIIEFTAERIACKFMSNEMLLYWLKKSYFALIACMDLSSGRTTLITSEINPNDMNYVLTQLLPGNKVSNRTDP